MFWFFGREACGILAPRPGIEPAPPALEGEVLTTGPPRKSPCRVFSEASLEDTNSKRPVPRPGDYIMGPAWGPRKQSHF